MIKPCSSVDLLKLDRTNEKEAELCRLLVAERDLAEAVEAFDLIQKDDREDPRFWAYFYTSIVAYARPFVVGPGRKGIAPAFQSFDDTSLADLHQRMIRTRNKVVAHSDQELWEVHMIRKGTLVTEQVDGATKTYPAPSDGYRLVRADTAIGTFSEIRRLFTFQRNRLKRAIDSDHRANHS